jgi:hypothetical protein
MGASGACLFKIDGARKARLSGTKDKQIAEKSIRSMSSELFFKGSVLIASRGKKKEEGDRKKRRVWVLRNSYPNP